jgi:RHS repeat-associated protein
VQETIWLGDTPVATIRPKTGGVDIFYVHADHLNTPRKVTRPSDNKLRWRWDPTPFGTATPNQNPQNLGAFGYNLRFPGQYYDAESGLNYNYFRDYDPQTGRYVQSDPIGLLGGLNTYSYVAGAPLTHVDPKGLEYGAAFGVVNRWTKGPYWNLDPGPFCSCPKVPPGPPGSSCDDNIKDAREQFDPLWFYNQVRNKGPWDYKQQGNQYENFGNFNFGASGSSFGLWSSALRRGAGWAGESSGNSQPGHWWSNFPYGDDPKDQQQIDLGIRYYQCKCFK